MFFHILVPLADQFGALNVFRYLTFRTGGAVITALIISFLFGPVLIEMLKSRQKGGQPIRQDGPETHLLTKQGTPTMGGVLILLALGLATLLWADLSNGFIWATLGVTLAFGFIGFLDDFMKVSKRDTRGLPGKLKLVMQVVIAAVATFWIMRHLPAGMVTTLTIPFLKNVVVDLGCSSSRDHVEDRFSGRPGTWSRDRHLPAAGLGRTNLVHPLMETLRIFVRQAIAVGGRGLHAGSTRPRPELAGADPRRRLCARVVARGRAGRTGTALEVCLPVR